MTDTFIRLQPMGSGYTFAETGRTDGPMFVTHYVVGAQGESDSFDTQVSTDDFFAFIVGVDFDNGAGSVMNAFYIDESEEEDSTWLIVWEMGDTLGSDAFFDVLFISKGLCTEVEQPEEFIP